MLPTSFQFNTEQPLRLKRRGRDRFLAEPGVDLQRVVISGAMTEDCRRKRSFRRRLAGAMLVAAIAALPAAVVLALREGWHQ